jgi:hypothetical protein
LERAHSDDVEVFAPTSLSVDVFKSLPPAYLWALVHTWDKAQPMMRSKDAQHRALNFAWTFRSSLKRAKAEERANAVQAELQTKRRRV